MWVSPEVSYATLKKNALEIFSRVLELQTSQSVRLKALTALRNFLQKFYQKKWIKTAKKVVKTRNIRKFDPKNADFALFRSEA